MYFPNKLDDEKIIEFFNSRISYRDMDELKMKVEESQENLETFTDIRNIWINSSVFAPEHQFDRERAWKSVNKEIAFRSNLQTRIIKSMRNLITNINLFSLSKSIIRRIKGGSDS